MLSPCTSLAYPPRVLCTRLVRVGCRIPCSCVSGTSTRGVAVAESTTRARLPTAPRSARVVSVSYGMIHAAHSVSEDRIISEKRALSALIR